MEMVKNPQPDSSESDSGRYQPMIRDLPNGERPRERLREYGSRNSDGNSNSPQAVVFLTSVVDVTVGY